MREYYPGYIFRDGDDYPEIAAWCNANGCYIKELTPDDEGRRFEIVKIPPKSLDEAKADKIAELNAAKNKQLDTGGLEYEEDLFAYDDKALLRISGTILDWQDQISRGIVQPEDIIQPWISKANRVHPLRYDQLIELARLLRQEVQRIVFYGTYLEKLAQAATTLEELDAIVWDYGAAQVSGLMAALLSGATGSSGEPAAGSEEPAAESD